MSRLSLHNFDIEETVDLTAYGEEIYDLLPLDATDQWPVVAADQFRPLKEAWLNQVQMASAEIGQSIPAGNSFILVDEDRLAAKSVIAGRRCVPFPERNGQYWGLPGDDAAAVKELERLRFAGAGFIVFAWPAFWWLEHYAGLALHLRSNFTQVLETERLVVFDLRRSGPAGTGGVPHV